MGKRRLEAEPVVITEPEFNLTVEPWVRAVLKNGSTKDFGLIDLFRNIDDIVSLRVESELEEPAIFRMLMAICYRALNPVLTQDWVAWWDSQSLPVDRIVEYLDDHKDDFWLFHPSKPFMQTVIEPKKGASKPFNDLDVLVSEPIGQEVESNRSDISVRSMDYAEIARRLVAAQQYSKYGTLGSYEGALDEIINKVYAGPAYLSHITLIRLKTGSLLKDLLLSIIPLDSGLFDFGGIDLDAATGIPSWEEGGIPLDGSGFKTSPLTPKTLSDVLTWPSRRIRLYKMSDGSIKVLFRSGKHVYRQSENIGNHLDDSGLEPMAAFYDVKDKDGMIVTRSWKAQEDKAFWRSLISLTRGDGRAEPLVLQWASLLERSGRLPVGYIANIAVITANYVTQGTKLTSIIKDSVSLPIDSLENPESVDLIDKAIQLAEKMVYVYNEFVSEIRISSGQDSKNAKEISKKQGFQAYDALGVKFILWVSSLFEDTDEDDWEQSNQLVVWADMVIRVLKQLADQQMRNLPMSALIGIDVKDKEGNVSGHYSAAEAENKLNRRLLAVRRSIIGKE